MNPIDITELARRLANLLRYGQIEQADYAQALVRVQCDGYLTGWLPWLTRRAGGDVDWWAPEVGEAVLVLAPDGDPALAVVLPAAYSDAVPPPETSPDIAAWRFGTAVSVAVDRSTGALTVIASGTVRVQAPRVEIAAEQVEITGHLSVGDGVTVTGDVTADGISLKTHKHGGVQAGGALTGAPQ
jgi:phage baseplate assembly protein V